MNKLENGLLKNVYDKCFNHFVEGINPEIHVNAYYGVHPREKGFAQSEFAGKYMDICIQFYKYTKNEIMLKYAEKVADSVVLNQREDGYIGGYQKGDEWEFFSVWNQAFTIFGLLSCWEIDKNEAYLASAEKSAEYNIKHFLYEGADIMDAPNFGSQHLAILIPVSKLYAITKKEIYSDFIDYVVDAMKKSDNNFFEYDSILDIKSKKAIENFCGLIGMLMHGKATGNSEIVDACTKYWEGVRDGQLSPTGNGTFYELWSVVGNKPGFYDESLKPNENCVAVGWAELSAGLFKIHKDAKYLDEIERTLYNHVLGSLNNSCSDFAYYQPNFGRRVTATDEAMNKCCRYRGFSLVSYIPEYLFDYCDGVLTPVVYTSSSFMEDGVSMKVETNYPFDDTICFDISGKAKLNLRIPSWCDEFDVYINGEKADVECKNGFVLLSGEWDNDKVQLKLNTKVKVTTAEIDTKTESSFDYISWQYIKITAPLNSKKDEYFGDDNHKKFMCLTYGSVVCVLDSHFGGNIYRTYIASDAEFEKVENSEYNLEFKCIGTENGAEKEVHVVDYASAAKKNENDEYTIWIRERA